MKAITLIIILACLGITMQAQSLQPQVVASGGWYSSNAAGSLSQTIGELQVQTFTNGTKILTQGFQQPFQEDWWYVGIDQPQLAGTDILLYPNPASGNVNIFMRADKDRDYSFRLIDNTGREIITSAFSSSAIGSPFNIDVSMLAAGLYFIAIQSTDNNLTQTIRFNKN